MQLMILNVNKTTALLHLHLGNYDKHIPPNITIYPQHK